MKSLSIVIPCLNEEDSISFCLEKIRGGVSDTPRNEVQMQFLKALDGECNFPKQDMVGDSTSTTQNIFTPSVRPLNG